MGYVALRSFDPVVVGAVLNFAGGLRTLGLGSDVTGNGQLQVEAGTVTMEGDLNLAGTGDIWVRSGALNLSVADIERSQIAIGGALRRRVFTCR